MRRLTTVLTIMLCCLPLYSAAGEKENELIDKIIAVYGGDALVNLTSYTVSERYSSITIGQNHSPAMTEIGQNALVLTRDIKNNNAVYDTWGTNRNGGFQGSTITDGEKAQTINYQLGTHGDANSADPYAFAGGTMRTSDAVLVYELSKVKEEAKLLQDEHYMNRAHRVLTMPFPLSADLKLYVDAQTFLISKMTRNNPQFGDLDYVFAQHQKRDGIYYATQMNFFIAGVPNLISTHRDAAFNFSVPLDTFSIPQDFTQESDRIDTSEMLVNKISDRVFHIGQDGGFSIFMDTNTGIVAAGGYAALTARFARFKQESKNYKPLAYQVVTHHHNDHIGGMGEAISLGARLVTVDDNVQTIKDAVTPTPTERDFLQIDSRVTFGEGRNRVEVYEVSTIHAARFLVTYVPSEKLVFIADHMGSPFVQGTPIANPATLDMLTALEGLNIDIRKIATAHNARIFSMQDMRDSVANFTSATCAGKRPVCN